MYECLYGMVSPQKAQYDIKLQSRVMCSQRSALGFTPFACEDRQKTKLKILKHKETLHFPNEVLEPSNRPSFEALDVMKRMLVEKEYRLCSRRYELNDYTRKTFGVSINSHSMFFAYIHFRE